MPIWDYLVVMIIGGTCKKTTSTWITSYPQDFFGKETAAVLTEAGNHGWEMVAVLPTKYGRESGGDYTYFFKRPR